MPSCTCRKALAQHQAMRQQRPCKAVNSTSKGKMQPAPSSSKKKRRQTSGCSATGEQLSVIAVSCSCIVLLFIMPNNSKAWLSHCHRRHNALREHSHAHYATSPHMLVQVSDVTISLAHSYAYDVTFNCHHTCWCIVPDSHWPCICTATHTMQHSTVITHAGVGRGASCLTATGRA